MQSRDELKAEQEDRQVRFVFKAMRRGDVYSGKSRRSYQHLTEVMEGREKKWGWRIFFKVNYKMKGKFLKIKHKNVRKDNLLTRAAVYICRCDNVGISRKS